MMHYWRPRGGGGGGGLSASGPGRGGGGVLSASGPGGKRYCEESCALWYILNAVKTCTVLLQHYLHSRLDFLKLAILHIAHTLGCSNVLTLEISTHGNY